MPQNGFLYSIGGENAGECDNSPVTHKAFSCEEVMRAIEKTARSCCQARDKSAPVARIKSAPLVS